MAGYERLQQCRTPSTDGEDEPTDVNGFDIFPVRAGLPWPTGFPKARQSRHWEAGLRISSELLELFSTDSSMFTAVKLNGRSLAKIASHELLLPEEDRFTKFATYLFPEADKERTRLLAATIVFIVIFDGKKDRTPLCLSKLLKKNADSWEMHSEDKVRSTSLQT